MLDQLTNHIYDNELGFQYQSGFKRNHSCETALLKIYQDVLGMMAPNKYVVMLFLDFSAAFDTVHHEILLQKLEKTVFFN